MANKICMESREFKRVKKLCFDGPSSKSELLRGERSHRAFSVG